MFVDRTVQDYTVNPVMAIIPCERWCRKRGISELLDDQKSYKLIRPTICCCVYV